MAAWNNSYKCHNNDSSGPQPLHNAKWVPSFVFLSFQPPLHTVLNIPSLVEKQNQCAQCSFSPINDQTPFLRGFGRGGVNNCIMFSKAGHYKTICHVWSGDEVVKTITLALVGLNCAETLVTKHQHAQHRAGGQAAEPSQQSTGGVLYSISTNIVTDGPRG